MKTYTLVQRFRYLFLRGNPQSYARMNRPNAQSKYSKILNPHSREPVAISDSAIAQHIAGKATYAAPLIGEDGFTREVALDIDQGGEYAVLCALHIAGELGYSAYGLVSAPVSDGHNGGHVRIPLAGIAAPERARLLATQIQQAVSVRCGLPGSAIDIYPTYKSLRLPFGVHTHSGVRGALLLQDGTRLQLDTGESSSIIDQAMMLLETLPANNPERLPLLLARAVSNPPRSSSETLQRSESDNPIQRYNQRINLLDWLVSIGACVTSGTRCGGFSLSCPCSNHKHQDRHPSLELQPARNPRHGTYILIGHSPGCIFATERGTIVNAFDAYCRWYRLNTSEAIKQIHSEEGC